MNSCHENVLVLGPVEDADHAWIWQIATNPPEEAVTLFLGRRGLERGDADALRVEVSHHVGDRSVFACCVHRLQHDQQRAFVFCEEALLEVENDGLSGLHLLFRALALLEPWGRNRIDIHHPEPTVAQLGAKKVPELFGH